MRPHERHGSMGGSDDAGSNQAQAPFRGGRRRGDVVTFSGTQDTVFHLTSDGAGATHVDSEFNFQGVSGVGDATGANYQLVGHGTSEFNATTEGTFEATIEISTNMVGQGPDNNNYVVTLYHLTLADGNPTSTVDSIRIDCR